jgi:phosphoribosylformylglycinamidine synthase
VVKHRGETVADLPIKELGDEAPLYDRPHLANTFQPAIDPDRRGAVSNTDALIKLVGSPDGCSGAGCGSSTTTSSGGNTVQIPGGDAAIVRVEDGPKALRLTVDVTPRYCDADPVEGGKQAVAEAWRN